MIDYIAKISQEEVSYICDVISAKNFRKLYQKHSSEFVKIKPGFRPNALSDEEALDLAKNNVDTAFIHKFINTRIDTWLSEISQSKDSYIKQGFSAENALLMTLKDSAFCERVIVYMHLSETEKSTEYTELLQAAIDALNATVASEINTESVESSFEFESEAIKIEREKWSDEKKSITKQNSDLRNKLKKAQENITKLERDKESLEYSEEKLREENENLNKRAKKAHKIDLSPSSDYPYRSLCIVFTGSDRQIRLSRIADIYDNIILDSFDESYPDQNNLFVSKDENFSNDYMGVWDWEVGPNKNDPAKHHIFSKYNNECSPIEIIILKNCDSSEDIIKSLTTGIEGSLLSDRIMFTCWNSPSKKYTGILCKSKELTITGNVLKLDDSVVSLPQYCFSSYKMLHFKNRYVFNQLDIGIPDQVVYVKDKIEIVKEKVLSRVSWGAMKQKGFTRNEYKEIREFLADLPAEELCADISADLDCSKDEAQGLLSYFIDHANEYLNGQNIEITVLDKVVQNDPGLQEKCKKLLSEDWEKENADRIAKEESNLDVLHEEIAVQEKKTQELEKNYSTQKEKYDKLLSEIDQEEKLAEDVEKKVKERIADAQKDAAEFIASQSFAPSIASGDVIVKEEVDIWEKGIVVPEESMETLDDWESAVDLISDELQEAGVSQRYSLYLAAYLYSAFVNKMPVLLIGPNGKAIADAFAVSISGKTSAVLHCGEKYCSDAFRELEEISEPVILIENLFAPQWHNQIINYIQSSKKFLIATTPYAEDMQIEPHGILNYWMPVLTDLFVSGKPSCNYCGGKLAEDFIEFTVTDCSDVDEKFLSNLQLSTFIKTRIKQIVSDVHDITMDMDDADMEAIFIWVPCSYVLGELDALSSYFDENSLDKGTRNLLNRYIGDPE